jgi:NADPH-dependent 2,4-dienoyl-CoA reductase/sulfur reductase-like enzyme
MSEAGGDSRRDGLALTEDSVPVCVIGAGPAGDAVSRLLARAGVLHEVMDENPRPGGNIDRRALGSPASDMEVRARAGALRLLLGVDVIDLSPSRVVTFVMDGAVQRRAYDAVFICTGAYDGAYPRRMLDSPGVTTAGALHALLKAHALVPQGHVVLVGSGPFLWVAAEDLRAGGADVRAVVDRVPLRTYLALGPFALLMPRRTIGWLLGLARLIARGGQISFGKSSDIASPGIVRVAAREIPYDHLGITDFFAPQNQLARSATCAQTYSVRGHYFHTSTDLAGRTSVDGVFVCGEGQGIHGREYAEVTGELAARAYAASIGRTVPGGRGLRIKRLLLRWYAARLEAAMYGPTGRPCEFVPESEACTCEHVRVEDVDAAIALGLRDLTSIKSVTRSGMGACQGRYCEPILVRLIERVGDRPREPFFQKGFVRPVVARAIVDADV